jgi:hypothetical protein
LVTATGFTDTAVTNDTTYHYVVTAVNTTSQQSTASNPASATPTTPPPTSPCAAPLASDTVLCLETDSGVTATGSAVAGWLDRSGNGNHLTASGDPTIGSVLTPAGKPSVSFDGSGDMLDRTGSLTGLPAGNANRSMFLVINYTSATGLAGATFGNAAANQAFGLTVRPANDRLTVQAWGGGNDLVSTTPGLGAGWLAQSVVLSGGTMIHYRTGSKLGSKVRTYDTVPNRIILGREIGDGGYIDGDIAAVLIYDRALSEEERQTVDAYLNSKYLVTGAAPAVAPAASTPDQGVALVAAPVEAGTVASGRLEPGTMQAGGVPRPAGLPWFCGLAEDRVATPGPAIGMPVSTSGGAPAAIFAAIGGSDGPAPPQESIPPGAEVATEISATVPTWGTRRKARGARGPVDRALA